MTQESPDGRWILLGREPSKRPPMQIGEASYEADIYFEIKRLIEEHDARDDDSTEDRYFMLEYGLTAHELIDKLGLSDEKIIERFGMPRDELAASLGMPSKEDLAIFQHLRAEQHAVRS